MDREAWLEELLAALDADRTEVEPQYPDHARFLLDEGPVQSAITSRIRAGRMLTAIRPLPYDFLTGLNAVYFEFARGGPVALRRDTVLVLSNSRNKVVGIVDPFDPDHPNHVMPGLNETDLPLVRARPGAADSQEGVDEEIRRQMEKTASFLDRVGFAAAAAGGEGGGGGGSGGGGGNNTMSTGYCIQYGLPELRCQPIGLFSQRCTQVQSIRRVLDRVLDDCSDTPA